MFPTPMVLGPLAAAHQLVGSRRSAGAQAAGASHYDGYVVAVSFTPLLELARRG